jgi:hypothetical protein
MPPLQLQEKQQNSHPVLGRNLRSVFTFSSESSKLRHFATFPRRLPELCIKSSTSEKGACPTCGAPWARVVEKGAVGDGYTPGYTPEFQVRRFASATPGFTRETKTTGWRPTCTCPAAEPVPCTVLDPFSGTATTGIVAVKLGRNYVGLELSPKYHAMAQKRLRDECGLLANII